MYSEEANLKASQEKAMLGATGQATRPVDCCGKAESEPLIWRLRREESMSSVHTARQRRAIDILERHPEFEELLELVRIVGF